MMNLSKIGEDHTRMTLEDIFSEDKERLDNVIQGNRAEQSHLIRCTALAEAIDWENNSAGSEFENMLGDKGVAILNRTIKSITLRTSDESAAELRTPKRFIRCLMFIHDLGKYNRNTDRFDGANHEERTADLVIDKREKLTNILGWKEESVRLLANLVRYHGALGITHIGEASIIFLSSLLDSLTSLSSERKRLFLDLLVILTCCDAGASRDFTTDRFYLDYSRLILYDQLSHELFALSEGMGKTDQQDSCRALLEKASKFTETATRIKRIVSSSNRLTVGNGVIESVLEEAFAEGTLNARSFALTRFDHGAYVFEPLLGRLNGENGSVSRESLYRLLLFIGHLCKGKERLNVIQFRNSFSMKADSRDVNKNNFNELFNAVEQGDHLKIEQVLRKHEKGLTAVPQFLSALSSAGRHSE